MLRRPLVWERCRRGAVTNKSKLNLSHRTHGGVLGFATVQPYEPTHSSSARNVNVTRRTLVTRQVTANSSKFKWYVSNACDPAAALQLPHPKQEKIRIKNIMLAKIARARSPWAKKIVTGIGLTEKVKTRSRDDRCKFALGSPSSTNMIAGTWCQIQTAVVKMLARNTR